MDKKALFAVVLLLAVSFVTAGMLFSDDNSADVEYSVDGDTLTYTGSGTATRISGSMDGIRNVVLGEGITGIGEGVFDGCTQLTNIDVNANNPNYASADGVLYNKAMAILIKYPGAKTGAFTVPSSVITIEDSAFYGCTGLTSVSMSSVTIVGPSAFRECVNLAEIRMYNVPSNLGAMSFALGYTSEVRCDVYVNSIEGGQLDGYKGSTIFTYKPMEYDVTYRDGGNASLSGILGAGSPTAHTYGDATPLVEATKIGYTFGGWFLDPSCDGAASASITDSYQTNTATITLYAKWTVDTYSVSLDGNEGSGSSFTATYGQQIPECTLSARGGYHFNGYYTEAVDGTCVIDRDGHMIASVEGYSDDDANWIRTSDVTLYAHWLSMPRYSVDHEYLTYTGYGTVTSRPDNMNNIRTIFFGDGITSIGDGVFEGCDRINYIDMPHVTTIGDRAFYGCISIDDVNMPSVVSIGNSAFYGCTRFGYADMPSVTTIGENAFTGCMLLSMAEMRSVTFIGDGAFSECRNLVEVKVPLLTSIGSDVFYGCSKISILEIPSVTTVGDRAFYRCSWLQSFSMPSVTTVGDHAFYGCHHIVSVTMPSVTTIGGNAFTGCTLLSTAEMPSVTFIGDGAFSGCRNLVEVEVPLLTSIGSDVFYGCSHVSILEIPLVTSIGDRAFYGCARLQSVSMPSVTTVGDHAFSVCSTLRTVTIPSSATSISNNAFDGCGSLTAIDVDAGNLYYSSVDGVLYDITGTTLIRYPEGRTGAFSVPSSVTTISGSAFYGCGRLQSVSMPSVTSIDSTAFSGCTALTVIDVGADNLSYSSVDGVLYDKERTTLIRYPIGKTGAFTVPSSVTTVGDSAFAGCTNLEEITMFSIPALGTSSFALGIESTPVSCVVHVNSTEGGQLDAVKGNYTTFTYEPLVYDLVYLDGNGIVFSGILGVGSPTTHTYGVATLLVDPTRTGYTFGGWFLDSECEGTEVLSFAADFVGTSANINIYAKWTANTYTVTFDENYGSPSATSQETVTYDSPYVLPDDPSRTGHSFVGWFTAASGGDRVTSATTVSITSDQTLYARWTVDTYSVSLNGNGGSDSSFTVTYDQPIPQYTSSVRIDYDLGGYYTEAVAGTCIIDIDGDLIASIEGYSDGDANWIHTSDVTLYAHWIPCEPTPIVDGDTLTYGGFGTVTSLPSDMTGITNVVFGENIGGIDDVLFIGCTEIVSVSMPAITSVGEHAFLGCTGLASVDMPSVLSVGDSAFFWCSGLVSVSMPVASTIGSAAFYGCTELVSVSMPAVTSVGDGVFSGCMKLTTISVGADNPSYSSVDGVLYNKTVTILHLFPGGKTGDFTVPSGVTAIDPDVFFGCSGLTSVTLPSSVISIGDSAFYDCADLTAINVDAGNPNYSSADGVLYKNSGTILIQFPAGKTGAFTIPSSVTSISESAFEGCTGLTSVVMSSVTTVGDFAFYGCTGLAEIRMFSIPSTLGIGSFALGTSSSSVSCVVYVSSSEGGQLNGVRGGNTTFTYEPMVYDLEYLDVDGIVFSGTLGAGSPTTHTYGAATALVDPTKTGYTFEGWFLDSECEGTEVSSFAADFIGTSANVNIYAKWTVSTYSVTLNGNGGSGSSFTATYGQPAPYFDEPTRGGYRPTGYFTSASGGDEVIYAHGYFVESVEGYTDEFGCWIRTSGATLYVQWELVPLDPVRSGDTLTYSGIGEVRYQPEDMDGIKHVVFGDGVVSIDDYAFQSCYEIETVSISSSVISIGEASFALCPKLTSFSVSEGNTAYSSVDDALFDKEGSRLIQYPIGKDIATFTVAAGIESIDDYAFSGCGKLTSILVDGDNDNFSSYDGALYNAVTHTLIQCPCGKIGTVNIPSSTATINPYAFMLCNELTDISIEAGNRNYKSVDGILYDDDVTNLIQCPAGRTGDVILPDTVTSIDSDAFYGCAITSITMPSVTTIGDYSLMNAPHSRRLRCRR